jgi:hypothetical protein
MGLVGPRIGRLVEVLDGSRHLCVPLCESSVIIIFIVHVHLFIIHFVRGFEKGKVRTVIELGVLKSDKRKRVG